MKKAIVSYFVCVLMIISMMPMFSYAADEEDISTDIPETTEPAVTDEAVDPTVADYTAESSETEEEEPATDQEEPEAVFETKAQSTSVEPLFPGTATAEDTSKYSNSMKIYGIYLRRASGSINSNDRYGDAVLIESNGKYLLIDTGADQPVKNSSTVYNSNLVNVLNQIGVRELDVYISHMHGDHQGALSNVCKAFKVNKLYLPDIKLCEKYETPNTGKTIQAIYDDQVRIANNEGAQVVYLAPSFRSHTAAKTYNYFTVGAVRCSVIGPVGTYTINQFKSQDGDCGTKEGHYLNNCSLITIFSCGRFRFLSAGDAETQEETNLVNRYGYSLNCDMMKLSHHGLKTSNSSAFLARVTPMWSFAENHGYYSSSDGSVSRAQDYGYNYRAASSKHNFIADVRNNMTRIYIDSNNNSKADERPLTGWIAVKKKYQYYDGAGYIKVGWSDISGNKYFLNGNSGFRFTGNHTINKVKCKFDKYGKLTYPKRPTRAKAKSIKAKSKKHKIIFKWKKAARASRYQVFRSTQKNSGYVLVSTRSKKSKSYTNSGLKKGQTYYYKVRAIRYIAGTTLYGPFSKVKKVRAK